VHFPYEIHRASTLAYLDTIWIFAIAAALMVPLAFLMRRAKPGAGPAAMHSVRGFVTGLAAVINAAW
jgi:hypothetical protein